LTDYDKEKIKVQQEGIKDMVDEYKEMKKNEKKKLTKKSKSKKGKDKDKDQNENEDEPELS